MIPRAWFLSLIICGLLLAIGANAGSSAEPAKAGATAVNPVPLLRSPQESKRLAGLQRLQWGTEHDQAAVEALADLVESSIQRKKLTESAYLATARLVEGPEPQATDALAKLVVIGDWRIVTLAADGLANRQSATAAPALRRAYERSDLRDHYPARHAIVCALGEANGTEGVDALVDVLPMLDGQLKFEAVARLTRRTGKNFGDNAQEWSDWWRREGKLVPEGPAASGENPSEVPWGYVLPRFFDAPIYAKRVLFVVDRSGSMQSTRDGKTRLQAEQEELTQAIQKLPDDAWFGLIFFNDGVEVWRRAVEPATSDRKAEAIQMIWTLSSQGKTAAYDALERGIQIEGYVEHLLFLTDGKPTAGKITAPVQIVDAITKLNTFHRTRIDTLGFDTTGEPEEFLKRLAGRNYGKYYKLR